MLNKIHNHIGKIILAIAILFFFITLISLYTTPTNNETKVGKVHNQLKTFTHALMQYNLNAGEFWIHKALFLVDKNGRLRRKDYERNHNRLPDHLLDEWLPAEPLVSFHHQESKNRTLTSSFRISTPPGIIFGYPDTPSNLDHIKDPAKRKKIQKACEGYYWAECSGPYFHLHQANSSPVAYDASNGLQSHGYIIYSATYSDLLK